MLTASFELGDILRHHRPEIDEETSCCLRDKITECLRGTKLFLRKLEELQDKVNTFADNIQKVGKKINDWQFVKKSKDLRASVRPQASDYHCLPIDLSCQWTNRVNEVQGELVIIGGMFLDLRDERYDRYRSFIESLEEQHKALKAYLEKQLNEIIDTSKSIYASIYVPTETSEEGEKATKKKRHRVTKQDMKKRNKEVATVASTFKNEYGRLPNVFEMVDATEYTRPEIYRTNTYKEGKIAKRSARVATEMTGSTVVDSEYFSNTSQQHSRVKRKSKAEQDVLDALIDNQKQDDKSNFVS
jgi:hypothetical protein